MTWPNVFWCLGDPKVEKTHALFSGLYGEGQQDDGREEQEKAIDWPHLKWGWKGLQKILSGRKLTQKEREGAGLQQSKWKTKQQKRVGGRCQGREKVTAAVLEETPAQGAEWQQDGYPCADELSPFPGARPMGGMPRTRLTQVTWGGCCDCYRRSPEWTYFPPLRIPLSILYKPPGEFRIAIRRRKGAFPNRTKFQVRKYCKVTGQAWEGPERSPRDVAKRVGSALGTNTLQGPRASGGSTSVREKTNELVSLPIR